MGSHLLPMRGQEPITRRPLQNYHRYPIGEASSSSTPMDPRMAVLNRLEQGHHTLTSQMGCLELGQATTQTHLNSLDTMLTTVESDMLYAMYSIYHDYLHQGLVPMMPLILHITNHRYLTRLTIVVHPRLRVVLLAMLLLVLQVLAVEVLR